VAVGSAYALGVRTSEGTELFRQTRVSVLPMSAFGFPGVHHDDQVDSVSQTLAFIRWRESHRSSCMPLRIWWPSAPI